MSASVDRNAAVPTAGWRDLSRPQRLRIAGLVGWIAVATLAFIQPLIRLTEHAAQSELHSYIPLVPLVAVYLLYLRRKTLPSSHSSSITPAILLCVLAAVSFYGSIRLSDVLSVNDALVLTSLAYVSVLTAGGILFLGSRWMAAAAFPIAFLIFVIPLPDAAVHWIERTSVLASADVSAMLFRMTGTPLVRDGTVFTLPGIVFEIGQECSGIHSSLVLFITSLVASQLFLTSPWRRIVLVAFVLPLAIVRNSFRILVIGLLCVHIGPHMIDSYIHRQGGPIFFVLSLAPLFLLLVWLKRRE